MDKDEFEGSRVLEMLAKVNLLDDFYEAIDEENIDMTIEKI